MIQATDETKMELIGLELLVLCHKLSIMAGKPGGGRLMYTEP